MLVAQGLRKAYRSREVVKDFGLTLDAGEVVRLEDSVDGEPRRRQPHPLRRQGTGERGEYGERGRDEGRENARCVTHGVLG